MKEQVFYGIEAYMARKKVEVYFLSEATLVTVTRLTQIPHRRIPNPPKTPGPGRGRHRPARDSRQGPGLLQPRSLPSLTYLCIRTLSSTSLNLSLKSSGLSDVAWRRLLAANQSLRMCPIRPSWPAFGHQTWPWTQQGLICPWDSDAGHVFPLLTTLTRRPSCLLCWVMGMAFLSATKDLAHARCPFLALHRNIVGREKFQTWSISAFVLVSKHIIYIQVPDYRVKFTFVRLSWLG